MQVGPQKSEIELDFDSSESARYVAEITSLPAAPMPVAFAGDDETRAAVQDALSQSGVHVSLVGASDAAGYALTASDGRLVLTAAGRDQAIGFADVAGGTLARSGGVARARREAGDAVGALPHAAEPSDGDGPVAGGRRLRRAAATAVNAARRPEADLAYASGRPMAHDPGPLSRPQPHRAAALGGAGVLLGGATASTS